jgi:HSP20 family protein
VTEKDVQVELADDVLTLRGEKRIEQEDAHHHLTERAYGSFSRSIQLPFGVDPEHLQASFANGVLTVTVPKAAAKQQTHRIQVTTGAASEAHPSEAPAGGVNQTATGEGAGKSS